MLPGIFIKRLLLNATISIFNALKKNEANKEVGDSIFWLKKELAVFLNFYFSSL